MKQTLKFSLPILMVCISFISCDHKDTSKINLAGEWHYRIDSLDTGMEEKWYSQKLDQTLTLPGSLTTNGLGDEISLKTPWTGQVVDSSFFLDPEYEQYRRTENFKIPFWLQPVKYYRGAVWYQKKVRIPDSWKDRRIILFLERCHWESRLWVDEKEIGMRNSLGTPHKYELKGFLEPGVHTLTIIVDNRIKEIDPGINSHSVSDHTQTNWNGMIGEMYLEASSNIYFESVKITPVIHEKTIRVDYALNNLSGKPANAELMLELVKEARPAAKKAEIQLAEGMNHITSSLYIGDEIRLWDEFSPELYTLRSVVRPAGEMDPDSSLNTFGMRSFRVENGKIKVNDRPVFLRGTLECAIFPLTGYPAMDVDSWQRIFRICREHGLNHMRFHSWCPPEAAFRAADLEGFYLHVECSSWANYPTTLGDSLPFDRYLYEESQRMIDTYGNHPSFCMMAYGNEPGGENAPRFLSRFVSYWKERDNRRIYTSGAGWPNLPVNDYLSDPTPRIQHWEEGLASIINAFPPTSDYSWNFYTDRFTQPMVSHEIGQWCVYPDFKEIDQYTGVLKARNFEIFRRSLEKNRLGHLADSFLNASGKLQVLCYKADIEAALRTRNFGGFQLLDIHDFPGQGTALVGILNPFWEQKGYVKPEAFKAFCNATVPLARIRKFTWLNNETFEAFIQLAHYGPGLLSASPVWKISDSNGLLLAEGVFRQADFPSGDLHDLGWIRFSLDGVAHPKKLVLEVTAGHFTNTWDFWVYPSERDSIPKSNSIRVVQELSDETMHFLRNGGTVLLTIKKGALNPAMGGDIPVGFSSIFWNTAWTSGQPPHTLGILCNPLHPALSEFPTEYHSNWQWWDAMSHSGAIDLAEFPEVLDPVVRIIDNWFTNRSLALIFEAKVGSGKILVTGIDLLSSLDQRLEAQQLLYSLKKYLSGEAFNPPIEVEEDLLKKLF